MSEDIDEIWALYADDGAQSLDTVEAALLRLRGDHRDGEAIAELFRAMHTFKGNSRLIGLVRIETCAHLAEDLIGLVRDEGVQMDAELLDLLLEAGDRLREMMESAVVSRRDPEESVSESICARMKHKYSALRGEGDAQAAPDAQALAPAGTPANEVENETFETAVLFGPPQDNLAKDPLYLKIFLEMARDAITRIALTLQSREEDMEARGESIRNAAGLLSEAAGRIGFVEWQELADAFSREASNENGLAALLEQAEELCQRSGGEREAQQGSPEPALDQPYDAGSFLKEIAPHLDSLCKTVTEGETLEKCDIADFCDPIKRAASRLGYIRIVETVAALPSSLRDPIRFETLLFRLYEDLSLIREVEIGGADSVAIERASRLLETWYSTHLPAALTDLAEALNGQADEIDWNRVVACQERIHRACRCLKLDTPGRVAVALLDLAARVASGEIPPDPLLLSTMRSFNEAARSAVSSASDEAMRRLLGETAEVTEALSGAAPVRSIEHLLHLPPSFQGVLSPESARSAAERLASGDRFYIIRADIDPQPELANKFFDWTNASGKIIGCVTVPADRPIFDFLIAAPLESDGISTELLQLDPAGEALRVIDEINHAAVGMGPHGEGTGGERFDAEADRSSASSTEMLETIEEIVTGHGAMREIISSFDKARVLGVFDAAMAGGASNWTKARETVHRQLQDWQEDVDRLLQLEKQLEKRLRQLQEDTVGARMRPASPLLQYLVDYAAAAAQRHGRALRFAPFNQNEPIDADLLDQLSDPLRSLISISIAHSIEPPAARVGQGKAAEAEMRLGVMRYLDRVVATVEDDGAGLEAQGAGTAVDAVRTSMRSRGGDVVVGASQSGGLRVDVVLPLSMSVLAGMIVRAGAVMYIVPIHSIQRIVHSGGRDLVYLSAGSRTINLKLGPDRLVPIRFLSDSSETRAHLLAPGGRAEDDRYLFVIAEAESTHFALSIDEVVGEQLVIVRPMKGYLSSIRNVMGCALLANGEIGMVLDMASIGAD